MFLSIFAQSYPFSEGDKILIFDNEYPSTSFPFINLEKKGIEIEYINYENFINSEQSLDLLPTTNVKAIAFSHVGFMTGIKLNLNKIVTWCKQHNIISIVDTTQSMIVHNINIKTTPVDVLITSGYKWLMSPNGIAFSYIDPEILKQLAPITAGWISTIEPFALPLKLEFKQTAEMLEPGGKGLMELVGTQSALNFILKKSLVVIQHEIKDISSYLISKLSELNIKLAYDYSNQEIRHIFIIKGDKKLFDILTKSSIICTYRQNKIRFSLYIFNTHNDIEYLCSILHKYKIAEVN